MDDTAAIDFHDLQGLFRFAHGQLSAACFMLLQIRDPEACRSWLQTAPVTSAATTRPPPERVLQIGFSAAGLHKVGISAELIAHFSEPFTQGMAEPSRARRLGDTGANAPGRWDWGGTAKTLPDLLLMLYAKSDALSAWEDSVAGPLFSEAFGVIRRLGTNEVLDREPFGFADGISQPEIDWEGAQSTDKHDRSRYTNLLSPGELILGYPNEYGEYTNRPLIDAADDHNARLLPEAIDQPSLRDLGRNGGYLTFRQLEQDVGGFWQWLDELANGDSIHRERLAASMVGRTRDGEPLVQPERQVHDPFRQSSDRNSFDYNDDPSGRQCPIGAHIRRANPRTGDLPPGDNRILLRIKQTFGFDSRTRDQDLVASTRFHRMLRRGRPYGTPLSPELAITQPVNEERRGLHFVALGANIARQFEFVQSAWLANPKFGGLEQEDDPLVGSRQRMAGGTAVDGFSLPGRKGSRERLQGLPQFVTVRGGAYFFLPGLRALAYLSQGKESIQ